MDEQEFIQRFKFSELIIFQTRVMFQIRKEILVSFPKNFVDQDHFNPLKQDTLLIN